MKEAIKVQSVTIIIINGVSESFQSVCWVIQKTEEVPASGASFRLGKNKAKGPVCGQDGSEESGLTCSSGRKGMEKRIRDGAQGGNRDAERYRKVCKDGFPSGASRGQLMTRPQIKVHPCVVLSLLMAHTPGPAEESCSLLYSTMTEFSLPNPCLRPDTSAHTRKTQSPWAKAQNQVRRTGPYAEG